MAARSSPGGFVVATVTNPGSFMATITHPTGNGYYRDRILRDTTTYHGKINPSENRLRSKFCNSFILWTRMLLQNFDVRRF